MPSREPIAIDYVTGKYAFNWGARLTWDGALFYRGQLGTERQVNELIPRPVHENRVTAGYTKIASTGMSVVWLLEDVGQIVTTGLNTSGEGGLGTTTDIFPDHPNDTGLDLYTDISAGGNVPATGGTLYALASNVVTAWGANADGQMGMGDTTQRSTPTSVWLASSFGANAVRVHAGGQHTAILDSSGRVWTAGNNSHGQLGRGTIGVNDTTWGQVTAPGGGRTYVGIACSHNCTLLRLSDGTVMAVGDGSSNQLGPTIFALGGSHTATPTVVDSLSNIVELQSTGLTSWFLDSSGAMFVYGDLSSNMGLVGTTGSDFFTLADSAPRQVSIDWATPAGFPYTPGNTGLTVAHLGYASGTCDQRILVGGATRPAYAVIGSDGRVYVWSRNTHAQLGNGTTTPSGSDQVFQSVNGATGVEQLTYAVASIFCGQADATVTRLHFSPHHLSDTKVLRQLSTDPADPANWFTTGFNDSAWTSPVQVTPDPGFPPTSTNNNRGEPVWERDPELATNLNVLWREWLTLPAETDGLHDPGVLMRLGQGTNHAGLTAGPQDLVQLAHRTGLGAISNPWVNGTQRSSVGGDVANFWAKFITPGADNLFAWRAPDTRVLSAPTTDPTLWASWDRIVSYVSNVSHVVVTPVTTTARSSVQWVG